MNTLSKLGVTEPTRPKLADVARLAGTSLASASRVLNPSSQTPCVKEPIKRRVLQAAEMLNYTPNMPARALAGQKTYSIGYIISSEKHARTGLMETFLSQLGLEAYKNGYDLIIRAVPLEGIDVTEDVNLANHYKDMINSSRVDIIIIDGEFILDDDMLRLKDEKFPFIMITSAIQAMKGRVPIIGFDNQSAFREATEHLIKLGHKKIAVITRPILNTQSEDRWRLLIETEKLKGYKQAISKADIKYDPLIIVEGSRIDAHKTVNAIKKLLEYAPDITAIMTTDDIFAIQTIGILTQLGYDVPNDISVMGFNDSPVATQIIPNLSTVRIPIPLFTQTIIKYAQELLMLRKENKDKRINHPWIKLPCRLILRDSTSPAKKTQSY